MAWARLDDGFDDHPKVLALLEDDNGAAAIGLWTLCLAWAHRNTRKRGKVAGEIPAHLPRRYLGPNARELAGLLVKEGLWEACDNGSWRIHDFATYLPSEELSRARSESGRKGAEARWSDVMPAGERQRRAAEMSREGHGLRKIAAELGVSKNTVARDLAEVSHGNAPSHSTEPWDGEGVPWQSVPSHAYGTLQAVPSDILPPSEIAMSHGSLPASHGKEPASHGYRNGMAVGTTTCTSVKPPTPIPKNLWSPGDETRRCEGQTRSRGRCARNAQDGQAYCAQHNPDKPAAGDDPQFEAFWEAYPRKVAKDAARDAWRLKVQRRGVPAEKVIEGARRYAADPTRKPEFTAHPATWINQGRYDDAPAEQASLYREDINWG